MPGRVEEANRVFAEAVETHGGLGCPWVAAEALHSWGRALLTAGDHASAVERLDAALSAYQALSAGTSWTDTVLADRRRAASM